MDRWRDTAGGVHRRSRVLSPRSNPRVLFATYRDFSLQIVGVATSVATGLYLRLKWKFRILEVKTRVAVEVVAQCCWMVLLYFVRRNNRRRGDE